MTELTTRTSAVVDGDVLASARVSEVGQLWVVALVAAASATLLDRSHLPLLVQVVVAVALVGACSLTYARLRRDRDFRPSPWGLIVAGGPEGVWILRASPKGRPGKVLAKVPGATTRAAPSGWPFIHVLTVSCPDGRSYRFEIYRDWK